MKAIVKIPNVSWRGGRPRFNPGPKLRKLGYKGEDLRHPGGGAWFTLRETEDWARARAAEIGAKRKAKAEGKRPKPAPAGPRAYTLEDLFEDLFKSKRFEKKAEKTQRDYRLKAGAFSDHDPTLWSVPARELTRPAIVNLHEQLWEKRGLAMANGMIAVLRLAYSEALNRGRGGIAHHPCLRLQLETPAPRLRCASPAEIAALMAVADKLEPSIGDAIVIALFSGQRQGDVLALREEGVSDGRVKLRQRKTAAVVSVFALPMLTARLRAIRKRNKLADRVTQTIVADPRSGRPWNEHSFRHRFAELRAEAEKDCPSLADFRFQDLRDTAVTWLHRAGCTAEEIASVTGHSNKTVHAILKHYLVIDESTNDRAMQKLKAWMKKEKVRV